jgi:hypothetical protein
LGQFLLPCWGIKFGTRGNAALPKIESVFDLAPRHLLQLFRITSRLHHDHCGGAFDFMKLLQAMQLRCAGDWNDPRRLSQQPGDSAEDRMPK